MKYTILLTETHEGGLHVSIPALPNCTVEADTRDDAIRLACKTIAEVVSRSEVVQVEIPQQPQTSSEPEEAPWEWLGHAKEDTTWDSLFDEIEQNREASRKAT